MRCVIRTTFGYHGNGNITSVAKASPFDNALANVREALELYFEDRPLPGGIEAPIIAVQLSPGFLQLDASSSFPCR